MSRKHMPRHLLAALDEVAELVADALADVHAGRACFNSLTRQLRRIGDVAQIAHRSKPTLLPLEVHEDAGPSAG